MRQVLGAQSTCWLVPLVPGQDACMPHRHQCPSTPCFQGWHRDTCNRQGCQKNIVSPDALKFSRQCQPCCNLHRLEVPDPAMPTSNIKPNGSLNDALRQECRQSGGHGLHLAFHQICSRIGPSWITRSHIHIGPNWVGLATGGSATPSSPRRSAAAMDHRCAAWEAWLWQSCSHMHVTHA